MLSTWDHRRHLAVPGPSKATITYAVEHWVACAKESIERHQAFYVALSGGSTPQAIFKALTQSPFKEMVPWGKIHLFWSDERSVPPNHPDSNFKMAMDCGLNTVSIPEHQIHRMIAEDSIENNALAYEATIHRVLKKHPFDLVMLGMGDDGHTASLFPHTQALHVDNRLIVANQVPQKGTWRMTMTYPCINGARHIALYVIGASKKAMVAKILSAPEHLDDYPVQHIGTPTHPALWILDEEAASGLNTKRNK
ncbi:MAG: 6-phosphogluconolactonase [Simkania sp.]|nr:6-phosphogluconolactonase [Simkania sp.]